MNIQRQKTCILCFEIDSKYDTIYIVNTKQFFYGFFFHQTLQYIVFEVFTLCELYPISSLPFLLLLCDVVSSPVFILFYCSIMSPLASSQSLTRKEIDKKMPLNYRSFSSLELHLDFTDPFQKNSEKNEENIYEQQKLHFFSFQNSRYMHTSFAPHPRTWIYTISSKPLFLGHCVTLKGNIQDPRLWLLLRLAKVRFT